jgi:hypothetical protein
MRYLRPIGSQHRHFRNDQPLVVDTSGTASKAGAAHSSLRKLPILSLFINDLVGIKNVWHALLKSYPQATDARRRHNRNINRNYGNSSTTLPEREATTFQERSADTSGTAQNSDSHESRDSKTHPQLLTF